MAEEAVAAVGDRAPKFGQKDWVDANLVEWRLRGERWMALAPKRLRELLLDPNVAVVHEYIGGPRTVTGEDRNALWLYIQAHLDGEVAVGPNDRWSLGAQEFRNDARERLLVLWEGC